MTTARTSLADSTPTFTRAPLIGRPRLLTRGASAWLMMSLTLGLNLSGSQSRLWASSR